MSQARTDSINKWHLHLFILVGTLSIHPTCSGEGQNPVAPATRPPGEIGVNLISLGNRYQDRDYAPSNLGHFMNQLATQGMKRVSLRVTWSTMEPEAENYQAPVISNLARLCTKAKARGIRVLLDFHTLFHSDSYSCPKWVRELPPDEGETARPSIIMIARSQEVARRYIAMVGHVSRQLAPTGAIDVVSIMNEPWSHYWNEPHLKGAEYAKIEGVMERAAIEARQAIQGARVTARFTSKHNGWAGEPPVFSWNRLTSFLDILSVNTYRDPTVDPDVYKIITTAAQRAREAGRDFWITEFGREFVPTKDSGPGDTNAQALFFRHFLAWWSQAPHQPSTLLAWTVQPAGNEAYNLFDPGTRAWNPAWFILGQYAKGEQALGGEEAIRRASPQGE
jgi:hypothetical protein